MIELDNLMQQAEAWLRPLDGDDGPCGPDLEYDNAFLALTTAAEGKPETQFERGVPPDWRAVRVAAEGLLERSRDLRVALLWLRAMVNLEGAAALLPGLRLVHGLLQVHWEQLHPRPDDGDEPFERSSALAVLPSMEGALGDLLNARLAHVKGVGDLRLRDVEVAVGQLAAREGEPSYSREQIERMLDGASEDQAVWSHLQQAQQAIRQLGLLMDQRLGPGSGADLKPLLDLHGHVLGLHGGALDGVDGVQAVGAGPLAAPAGATSGAALAGSVHSRADALRAIEMVCAYLERHEPTNPAPLFLRRAAALIDRSFLELLKELAPAALDDVARIVGVDPGSVGGAPE